MDLRACQQSGSGADRASRPGGGRAGAPRAAPHSEAQLVAADPRQRGQPGRQRLRQAARPAPLPAPQLQTLPALGTLPFLLGPLSPSCLLLSDGLRSPGGMSMAGGPAGGSAAPRGPGAPALPSPRARGWRAAGPAQPPPRAAAAASGSGMVHCPEMMEKE